MACWPVPSTPPFPHVWTTRSPDSARHYWNPSSLSENGPPHTARRSTTTETATTPHTQRRHRPEAPAQSTESDNSSRAAGGRAGGGGRPCRRRHARTRPSEESQSCRTSRAAAAPRSASPFVRIGWSPAAAAEEPGNWPCRPRRSPDSMAGRAMRATSPRSRNRLRCSAEKYTSGARSLTGLRRRGPRVRPALPPAVGTTGRPRFREGAKRGGGGRAERRRQIPPGTASGQQLHLYGEHDSLLRPGRERRQ